jgi:hypothetical protein
MQLTHIEVPSIRAEQSSISQEKETSMKSKLLSSWGKSLLLTAVLPASSILAQLPPGPWQPPTNSSPAVLIITPHEGQILLAGGNVHICAATMGFTDAVASVTFYAGTNSLGTVTNPPTTWGVPQNVFCLTWSNVASGSYGLTAMAVDVAGNSAVSPVVDVSVVTNLPPRVQIFKPFNGAMILGPTNVLICASAFDPDGTVTSVEFFDGSTSLGSVPTPPVTYVTNWHGIFPIRPNYCLTLTNASLGTHVLTAVATDNGGATGNSAAVTINVVSNLPPHVRIEKPYPGQIFFAPANILICAQAADPDGTIASVEFFNGTNSLGVVTTPTLVTNWWGVEKLYCLSLTGVSVGNYVLKAVATDNGGATGTSMLVPIKVVPPPMPTVTITSPRNGSTIFGAPTTINVCAVERYFTNPIVNVQFFAGTNSIGSTTNSPSSCIHWPNVGPGAYSLTATATDSQGAMVTSAAVNIMVVTNLPTWWGSCTNATQSPAQPPTAPSTAF